MKKKQKKIKKKLTKSNYSKKVKKVLRKNKKKFRRKSKKLSIRKSKKSIKKKTKKISKQKFGIKKISDNYNNTNRNENLILRLVKFQLSFKQKINVSIKFNLEKYIQRFFD